MKKTTFQDKHESQTPDPETTSQANMEGSFSKAQKSSPFAAAISQDPNQTNHTETPKPSSSQHPSTQKRIPKPKPTNPNMHFSKPMLSLLATTTTLVAAGPAAYGTCQVGCAALVTACYAAAGFVFGTTIVGAPPAIMACNSAFGTCQAACWAALIVSYISVSYISGLSVEGLITALDFGIFADF